VNNGSKNREIIGGVICSWIFQKKRLKKAKTAAVQN
jgi:hypothetical protein